MDLKDNILRVLAAIDPAIPMAVVVVAATLVLLIVCLAVSDNLWINQKKFRILGVFIGLNSYDCYRLAVSWIRLLMAVVGIAAYREMVTVEYIIFLIAGLLYVLDIRKPYRIFKNLLWFVLQFAGLLSVNLLCGYLKAMVYASAKVWVVYIFLVVFLVFFSLFLFLNELDLISRDRKPSGKGVVHGQQH